MKKLALYLLSLCIVLGAGYGASFGITKIAAGANIILDNLSSGETITPGFVLNGRAPGSWFFEGTFPVQVVDQNGDVVSQTYAQAKEDWMTSGQVAFSAKILFTLPAVYNSQAKILFKKDNPSGMPENDVTLELPIVLSP